MSDDVLLADEENELYGYGVFNVHKNVVVTVEPDKDGLREEFARLKESMGSVSHLRVVKICLDNELDNEVSK